MAVWLQRGYPSGHSSVHSEIRSYSCTLMAIRFFTRKHEILQLYPNDLLFFENCTQIAIRFLTTKYKI